MVQFAKDVDAVLMRPDAALRTTEITIDFLELTFTIFEN